jgi:hypothetical protein
MDPYAGFPDLHLAQCLPFGQGNAAEGNGVLISSVTNDFDDEIRSTLTPVDIGADAGNYANAIAVGNYPDTNIIAGGNIVLYPDTISGVPGIKAIASAGFTGTIHVDPFIGILNITNAGPAGVYTISVWVKDSVCIRHLYLP